MENRYLTGAYVNQDNDGEYLPNTTLWYLQGGVTRNWTGWGNTVLYAEYARVDDGAAAVGPGSLDGIPSYIATSEASMWGIGVVQHIDAAAMELFLSFRQYRAEADINVGEYGEYPRTFRADDFNAVMSGARIRF